jgi:y4mF family transcriptional regulator
MQRQIQNTTDIGQTVQTYRKKQGLTQEELALLANVGRRFVVELEQGKNTAQIGKILQVLHALGIGLNLLVTWDETSKQ